MKKALSILEQLDDETGTSLDHSMEGPLTDAEFMKVISRFLTIDNYEALKPYLLRTQEKIEKNGEKEWFFPIFLCFYKNW